MSKPKTDWNIGLKREGKKPYDTYIAYNSLSGYFNEASIKPLYSNYDFSIINNDDYNANEGNSLLIVTGRSILFSPNEWESIKRYIYQGNEVLILGSEFDVQIEQFCKMKTVSADESKPLSSINTGKDNLKVLTLDALPNEYFGHVGRDLKGYFELGHKDDSTYAESPIDEYAPDSQIRILGSLNLPHKSALDSMPKPNFIQYSVGQGHLTLVASPLVMSNYFLLQNKNRNYFEHILGSVSGDIYQVNWANFLYRSPNQSTWDILWRKSATRWALISFMILIAAFFIFQTKRKQRIIPVIEEPNNSSVAFIETIGMLYYNKGDNANLALKMEQHFMDWVRTHFYLNTNTLNDVFEQQLSLKSSTPIEEVSYLIGMIHQIRMANHQISDTQLFELYNCIQKFYKKEVNNGKSNH